MKKKMIVFVSIILALFIVFVTVKTRITDDTPPQAEDNEIKLNIELDLEDDIGLFLICYDVNGAKGAGGVSNADRSMLKKDSKDLYWSFYKEQLKTDTGTVDMLLFFTIVTEYFEPNYDNNYPEEYMIPIDAVSLQAEFGKTYHLTIKGSNNSDY